MKLIIDIPEMAYDAYKEWHKNKVATVEQSLIANGIPYNPTGDCISREALKEALHNFFDGKVIDEPAYILRDVFCYIDNAPTVEYPFYAEAYQTGYEEGKNDRPIEVVGNCPLKSQGDLISRDALKKEIQKELDKADLSEYEACICVTSIYDRLIDNAPTVDNPYQEGHIDGMLQAEKLYARPVGEWIDKLYNFGLCTAKCSICGARADGLSYDTGFGFNYSFYNYCPNCGAYMQAVQNEHL